jgi:hypothetical protein
VETSPAAVEYKTKGVRQKNYEYGGVAKEDGVKVLKMHGEMVIF